MFCTNCGSNEIDASGVCTVCGHRMGGAPAVGIPTGRLDIAGGVKKMFRHPVFITATILMLATWVISIFSVFSALNTVSSYGVRIDLDGFFSALEYLPDEMRFFIILVMVGIIAILVSGIMCVVGLVKSLCYSFDACKTPGLGALKGYCALTIIGLSAIVAGYTLYIVQLLGQIPSFAREYVMDQFWEQAGPPILIRLVVIVLLYIYYSLMLSMINSVSNTLKYNTPMKKPSMFVAVFNFILAICGIYAIFASDIPLKGMDLICSIAQLVALALYGVLIVMARNITFDEIYEPATPVAPVTPEATAPIPQITTESEETSTYCTECGKALAFGEKCDCRDSAMPEEKTSEVALSTDETYFETSEPAMSGALKSTMRKPGSAPASYHGATGPNKFMSRPDDLD